MMFMINYCIILFPLIPLQSHLKSFIFNYIFTPSFTSVSLIPSTSPVYLSLSVAVASFASASLV